MNCTVSPGALSQYKGGETPFPSQVYFLGSISPSTNFLLANVNDFPFAARQTKRNSEKRKNCITILLVFQNRYFDTCASEKNAVFRTS